MANIKYQDTIAHLFEAMPDIRAQLEARSKELYGEGLPHVVYGSVLVEYLDSLADEIERQRGEPSDDRLKKAFEVIEDLSGSDDFETICLVQTSFLEGLLAGKSGVTRFAEYLGPKTRKLLPL